MTDDGASRVPADAAPDGEVSAPAVASPDGEATKRTHWRGHPIRNVFLVLGGALLVVVLVVVGVVIKLDSNIERLDDPFAALPTRPTLTQVPEPGATQPPAGEEPVAAPQEPAQGDLKPVNMLVLGTDSRISAGDPGQWERGAQRTDVMMLVHLPASGDAGYVMSIPRDSWVPIPGHGTAKLNAAFSLGGPSLLIQTIEQLTGVPIDHFAVADFESFQAITDALGGVRISLREDLVHKGELIAGEGERVLSGEEALIYVRQRMNLARGDFDRVQRQQAWIRSMVDRARSQETLKDPAKWYPVLDAVTESVAVDAGLSRNRMVDLLMRVKDLKAHELSFFTVPIAGIGTSADGQSIVNLDQEHFDLLMTAVQQDRVDEFLDEYDDEVDRLPLTDP